MNTTDFMIAGFLDEGEINEVNNALQEYTEYKFESIGDGSGGGSKVTSMSAYTLTVRSQSVPIESVIDVFKRANFQFPESVALIIDCDDKGSWVVRGGEK